MRAGFETIPLWGKRGKRYHSLSTIQMQAPFSSEITSEIVEQNQQEKEAERNLYLSADSSSDEEEFAYS